MSKYNYMVVDTTTQKSTIVKMGSGRTIESTFSELKPNENFIRINALNDSRTKFAPILSADGKVISRQWIKI
jgi:hypothetical protein